MASAVRGRRSYACFHFIEQPTEGICSFGPFPVVAIRRIATTLFRDRIEQLKS